MPVGEFCEATFVIHKKECSVRRKNEREKRETDGEGEGVAGRLERDREIERECVCEIGPLDGGNAVGGRYVHGWCVREVGPISF